MHLFNAKKVFFFLSERSPKGNGKLDVKIKEEKPDDYERGAPSKQENGNVDKDKVKVKEEPKSPERRR